MRSPQEVLQNLNLDDFKTKATLMGLMHSTISGKTEQLAVDFARVEPEMQQALAFAVKELRDYLTAVLEAINMETVEKPDSWPDEINS